MIRAVFIVIAMVGLAACASHSSRNVHFTEYFDNFPKSKEHIQKIVDHCWGISEELRSKPGLDPMTYGQYLTATCFEEQYIKLFLMVDVSGMDKTEEDLKEQFKKLRLLMIEDIYSDTNNIRGIANENVLSSDTQYTWLARDIFMDLVYEIHREYHAHTYPSADLIKVMEYLDKFTP